MPRRPTSTSTRRSPRGSWRRSIPISRGPCGSSRTGGTTRCSASATGTRCGCRGAWPRSDSCATSSGGSPSSRRALPVAVPAPVRNGRSGARARLRRALEHRAVVRRRERARVRSRDARRRRERAGGVRRRAAPPRRPRRMRRRTRSAACRSCTATRPCARGSPSGRIPEAAALLAVWERATRGTRVDRPRRVAARRPAPGEPAARAVGIPRRGHRLRRHHRRRPRHRPRDGVAHVRPAVAPHLPRRARGAPRRGRGDLGPRARVGARDRLGGRRGGRHDGRASAAWRRTCWSRCGWTEPGPSSTVPVAGDAMHGCRGVGSASVADRARLGSCTMPMPLTAITGRAVTTEQVDGRADTS